MDKSKATLVPFAYPGYPKEYLDRFTNESINLIKNLGIELITTPIVILPSDIPKAREILNSQDIDFIIALILSWVEAPNVIETLQESFHKPILLWSHTMFEENNELLTLGPIPAAGVIRQTFEELDVNFKFVYGMPEEEKVKNKIKEFSTVTSTIHKLKHSKIGLLGYASMGMYTATFDHLMIRQKIGPEIDHLDQYVLIKKIEEMKEEQAKNLLNEVKEKWEISNDVTEKDLIVALKMYIALKEIVKEFNWSALTIKCQYEFSKYYKAVPCVPLSLLGNEIPCSCEGDVFLIISQLVMHYLTGNVISYGDVHTISKDGILLGACGFAPFALGLGKPKIGKTTVLYEGLANCTLYKEGEVTITRIAYTKDRNFKMHIATGNAKKPRPFHEVGCLPYPSMEIILDSSPDEFAQQLASQHYSLTYGNFKNELLLFCELLGISPVLTSP